MGGRASVESSQVPGGWLRESVMTAGEPSDVAERPTTVTETLVADVTMGTAAEWEVVRAVTALFSEH